MKVLITGAEGFIGSHLVDTLLARGADIYAAVHSRDLRNLDQAAGRITVGDVDITRKEDVENAVRDAMPDLIFHMAAQAYVKQSWNDIEGTFRANVLGTMHLLDAIRKIGINPIVVVACSSAAYGLTHEDELPIKETKEFRPSSPYALSKLTADMLCYIYWRAYGMKIIRARLFNTIGPRKRGSALADFAEMIAGVEAGRRSGVSVGNLDGVVDFTDIHDCVEALTLLSEKGVHGEAYNICSGKGHKIGDVLNRMITLSSKPINVVHDPEKMRPLEDPVFVGDNSKLRALGWKPVVSMDDMIKNTLGYWRKVQN